MGRRRGGITAFCPYCGLKGTFRIPLKTARRGANVSCGNRHCERRNFVLYWERDRVRPRYLPKDTPDRWTDGKVKSCSFDDWEKVKQTLNRKGQITERW